MLYKEIFFDEKAYIINKQEKNQKNVIFLKNKKIVKKLLNHIKL